MTTMMENAISTEDLHKHYGSIKALDGVGFKVEKGSIFGLLGPNGAGKTTTIRIMTGLTKPDSGSVTILGHDNSKETIEAKKHIGVVPEASNIYDEMTAEQNLIFAAELYDVPAGQRRIHANELLGDFGLLDRGKDLVVGFSRGMKRRLTIACGMIHKPDILFLDEPTTGLDIQSALALRSLIRRLNQEGTTILLTTHYLEEADQLCDKIALINRGRIVAVDTPESLKAGVTGSKILEVSFSGPVKEDEIRGIDGVIEVHQLGDKFRLTLGESRDIVGQLSDFARSRKLVINTINTLKPSLEDAFLKITGIDPEQAIKDKDIQKPRRNDG